MEAIIGLILGILEGSSVVGTAVATFAAFSVGLPIVLGILRFFGIYAIVEEGTAHVYTLFGKVVLVLQRTWHQHFVDEDWAACVFGALVG